MERAAGLTRDDKQQAKLDKLDALLAQSFRHPQDAGALCGDAVAAERWTLSDTRTYTAAAEAKNTEDARLTVAALSHQNPVLMIFEDAHWIDPTSLEVLRSHRGPAKTLGVLLIITYRPGVRAAVDRTTLRHRLTINRLAEREIAAMIDGVTGNKPLPASIRQDIIERTDGIPLFVEEMTKAVLEAESEGAARAHGCSCSVPVLWRFPRAYTPR